MVIYTTPYTKNLSFQLPSERIVLKLTDIKPISLLFILAHNHQFVQMIRWCKWVWAFQPFAAEARQLAAVTQFHHVPSQWQACPVELMFTVFWLIFTMLLCKAFFYFYFLFSFPVPVFIVLQQFSRYLQVISCIFVCLSHVLLWSLIS